MANNDEPNASTVLTVSNVINAPVEKVWDYWTAPEHIINWNTASDDWNTPRATNSVTPGGSFVYRMEAKDGSMGFDFGGTYDSVIPNQYLAFTLDDNRKVQVRFERKDNQTEVTETFEAETTNAADLQQDGWQAILNHFKQYVESH